MSGGNFGRRSVSDREVEIVQDVRRGLHDCGFAVLPANEGGKKPLFSGWQDYVYDPADPEPMVPRTQSNAGTPTKAVHFATGAKTAGIAAVDLDIEDPIMAQAAKVAFVHASEIEPAFERIRKNSGKRMLIYRVDGAAMPGISASNGVDGCKVEVDCNKAGQFVQLHGKHPSGVYVEYAGDQPWDVPLSEFEVLSLDALKVGYEAACRRVGIDLKNFSVVDGRSGVAVVERRNVSIAAEHAVDLLTGVSITPAAQEILRHLLFEYNCNPFFAEEFVRALIGRGMKMNPSAVERYENLLNQMDPDKQRIPLQASMERRWEEHVDGLMRGDDMAEMAEAVERRAASKMNAKKLARATDKMLIADVVGSVKRLPKRLVPQAMEYLKKVAGNE